MATHFANPCAVSDWGQSQASQNMGSMLVILSYIFIQNMFWDLISRPSVGVSGTSSSGNTGIQSFGHEVYDATIHIEQGEATVTWNEASKSFKPACFAVIIP
jgi:hypothetical protein